MFSYKSYDEATKIKSQITEAILATHDSVVSIGTEEETLNNEKMYSVKVGLSGPVEAQECDKILTTLKNANILHESLETITPAQKSSLFKHCGIISAQTIPSANFTSLYSALCASKKSLGLAAVVGGIGVAACLYKKF